MQISNDLLGPGSRIWKESRPQLLSETDEIRTAVGKYLSHLPFELDRTDFLLTQDAPAELLREADRLLTFLSLIGFVNPAIVRLVVLALLKLGPAIEGRSFAQLRGDPT